LLEWLAEADPQLRVLPNRFLHNEPKQATLFARALTLKLLCHVAGQCHQIDGFGRGSQSGRLALTYFVRIRS